MHRLVLHPRNSEYAPPSWRVIIEALRDIGFISEAFGARPDLCYFAGEKFLQLVTFMGCSPAINLIPNDKNTTESCYIQFKPIGDVVFRYTRQQEVRALCPQCGARVISWRALVEHWGNDLENTQFVCEKCAVHDSIYHLRWREKAGFARLFIDVCNIYPQEGIPTDQLLALLERVTQQKWCYFFTNN